MMKNLISGSLKVVASVLLCMVLLIVPERTFADAVQKEVVFGEKYEVTGNDKFTVTLPESGDVKVNFISTKGNRSGGIRIYDESGEHLFTSDNLGKEDYSISVDLKSGKYTFQFCVPFGSGSAHNEGIMTMEFTSAEETYAESFLETNDTITTASEVKIVKDKASVKGDFAINDKIDYYVVDIEEKSIVTVGLSSGVSKLKLTVLTEDLDVLLKKEIKSGSNKYILTLEPGIHYISLENVSRKTYGSYNINFAVEKILEEGDTFLYKNLKYEVTDKGEVAFIGINDKKATKVTVPKIAKFGTQSFKVTSVEKKALYNNKKVTKVVLGDNIKYVGADAFKGCTKLKTISVKKNVQFVVGDYIYETTGSSTVAFKGLYKTSLKKVTIASSVKIGAKTYTINSVADKALEKKTKITSVTIGTNVCKIGKSAFSGCKKLKSITINSKKITNVGSNALKGIYSKATIKVPKSKITKYTKLFKGRGQGSKVVIKY